MTEAMRFGQQQQEVVRRLFAMGLRELMDDLEMTQADLARAVWGTTVDKRGYVVARNRDRISQYLKGSSLPSRPVLKRIAKALGVEPDHLLAWDMVRG